MVPERFTITVADGHGDRIDDVVVRIEATGVHVEKVLSAIGVIIGSADPDRRRALAEIEGVACVEPDRTVRLPPPDSEVQ